MRKVLSPLFGLALICGVGWGQGANSNPFLRIDPAIGQILPTNAKFETLFDKGEFLEGPTWVHSTQGQYLIFSDIPGNVIDRWTPGGKVSIFLDHVFAGPNVARPAQANSNGRKPMIGPNGTTLDREGRVVFCGFGSRDVERIEKDGRRTILADRFEGKRFNSPDDLVYKSDGTLYFTDLVPDLTRKEDDPDKGVPSNGVYIIKNGAVRAIITNLERPNGLAFSPGEKYLYVNESQKRRITRFDVQPDDTVSNPKLFIDMDSDKADGIPDGMKVDKQGNVYCTGPGGLWIVSPDGKHIGTVLTPERLTNLTFGNDDGKALYMTGHQGLYRVELKIEGIRP